ncbi:MAG: hypothetical protein QM736_12425 [Vicinamibacterales bacterium]
MWRPASDSRVTRLEEVEIAAEAQDDFGVSALELVYAVRGGSEKVVPLGIPPRSTSVTGRYVLYLEDLDVTPGDFISYYVKARDLPRGKRASESRSDIFFLEVKPFEEEFTLAQTQAAMGGAAATRSSTISSRPRRRSSSPHGSSIGDRAMRRERSPRPTSRPWRNRNRT